MKNTRTKRPSNDPVSDPRGLIALGAAPPSSNSSGGGRTQPQQQQSTMLMTPSAGVVPSSRTISPTPLMSSVSPSGISPTSSSSTTKMHHQSAAPPLHHASAQQQQQQPQSFLQQQQPQSSTVNTAEQKSLLSASKDLVTDIVANFETNHAYSEALLIAALNYLSSITNTTPDHKYYFVGLTHLSKSKPYVFNSEAVIQKMIQILQVSPNPQLMNTVAARKTAGLSRVLLATVLMRLYSESAEWPVDFVKAFIDDSLGERLWVDSDSEPCKQLIANILTAYQPLQPSECNANVYNRFPVESDVVIASQIRDYTVNQLRVALHQMKNLKRRGIEISIIKFCTCCASVPDVRLLASQHLEFWLNQNPMQANQVGAQQIPILKFAKDLLNRMVSYMLVSRDPLDHETFMNIVTMKLKTTLSTYYVDTIAKLVVNDQFQAIAIRHFLNNECQAHRAASATSSINYFKTFVQVYRAIPEHGALQLGYVLQEMAAGEQFQSQLRPLLRRIVKNLLPSLDFTELCISLLSPREQMIQQPYEVKEKWINCLVDLVCLVCVTCKIHQTKEMTVDVTEQVSIINAKCMEWCQNVLPSYLPELSPIQYASLISHFLFLKPPTAYLPSDNLLESEKNQVQSLSNELPLQEATILHLEVICLRMTRLTREATLDLLHSMVYRAASYSLITGKNCLQVRGDDVLLGLLQLTCSDIEARFPPDSKPIIMPDGKTMCIRHLFWRACGIIFMLLAFNPSTLAETTLKIPTVKFLVDHAIKNQLPDLESMKESEQYLEQEQQQIARYCKELNERNTQYQLNLDLLQNGPSDPRLFQFFMLHDFYADIRVPPGPVLQQFIKLDKDLRIGNALRNSREPDMLSEIMRREGSQQSLKWLTHIIHSDINTLSILPVPILCELFLASMNKKGNSELVLRMIARLCEWLFNSSVDNSFQVLSFFLTKLADRSDSSRRLAKQSLRRLLYQDDIYQIDMDLDAGALNKQSKYGVATEQYSWIGKISSLICWPQSKEALWNTYIVLALYDTDLTFISTYTEFLYVNYVRNALEISLILSELLINRQYLSREMFSSMTNASQFHALVQKIFVEAFLFLRNTQMMLANSPEAAALSLVRLSDGKEFLMPNPYLKGIIAFASLPTNGQTTFTVPMLDKINLIIDPKSRIVDRSHNTEEPILTESLATKLLHTNSLPLIQKGLSAVSINGMLDVLCSFGVSKECTDLVYRVIVTTYIDQETRQSILADHLRQMPQHRIFQLVNCLEEQEDGRLRDFVKQFGSTTDVSLVEDHKATQIEDSYMKEEELNGYISKHRVWSDSDIPRFKSVLESGLGGNRVDELSSMLGFFIYGEMNAQSTSVFAHFARLVTSLLRSPQFGPALLSTPTGLSILTTLLRATKENKQFSDQIVAIISNEVIPSIINFLRTQQSSTSNITQYILSQYNVDMSSEYNSATQQLLRTSLQTDIIPSALDYIMRSTHLPQSENNSLLTSHFPVLLKRGSAVAEEIVQQSVTDESADLISIFQSSAEKRDIIASLCSQGLFVDLLMRFDPCVDVPAHRDVVFLSKKQVRIKNLSSFLMSLMTENQNFEQLVKSVEYARSKASSHHVDAHGTMQFAKTLIGFEVKDDNLPFVILQCILTLLDRNCTVLDLLENSKHIAYLESLLAVISDGSQGLTDCLHFLLNRSKTGISQKHVNNAKQLVLWLYTCFPDRTIEIIDMDKNGDIFEALVAKTDFRSRLSTSLDKMMHRINKVLLNQTGIQQKDGHVPHFANSLLRQTASTHPFIVLRYLESISALLEVDIVQTEGAELAPNVIPIFSQVLSVMDALRPHIFSTDTTLLIYILTQYFSLLKTVTMSQHDAFLPLVSQFADFLCQMSMHLATSHECTQFSYSTTLSQFLIANMRIMSNLQNIFVEVQKVKLLLFTVERLEQHLIMCSKNNIVNRNETKEEELLYLINRNELTSSATLFDHNITLLRSQLRLRDEQLKETLNYLDRVSKYSPAILDDLVVPALTDLITVEPKDDYNTDHIVTTSYRLIVRCLQFDSRRKYKQIIPLYLKCFMHRDRQVRLHAIHFAFDMFPFCNELSTELLNQLFYNQEKAEAIATLIEIIKMYIRV